MTDDEREKLYRLVEYAFIHGDPTAPTPRGLLSVDARPRGSYLVADAEGVAVSRDGRYYLADAHGTLRRAR